MRRARAARQGVFERFSNVDRTRLALFAAGAAIVLAAFFPRVYPAAKRGLECSDLAAPIGGNNRSILAQSGAKRGAIDLNLDLENETLNYNQSLSAQVTFVNEDIGPVILWIPGDQPVLRGAGQPVVGIFFEITRVTDGQILGTSNGPAASPVTFTVRDQLHLLGSRARCTERFKFSADFLRSIGVQPGDYRIRAFYRNDSAGDARPLQPFDATATPAYFDQGVWVGETSSREIRFTVLAPGAPTPVQ